MKRSWFHRETDRQIPKLKGFCKSTNHSIKKSLRIRRYLSWFFIEASQHIGQFKKRESQQCTACNLARISSNKYILRRLSCSSADEGID